MYVYLYIYMYIYKYIFTLDRDFVQGCRPTFVDVSSGLIEVAREGDFHVYLGSKYLGNLKTTGKTILANQLCCAWAHYHALPSALTIWHVDLLLRFRLFDGIVAPTAQYGLATASLTAAGFDKFASTRRHDGWQRQPRHR
ncbi:unnamed protein product [Prorocentrum cordatum]|uniref:Uncharacterized protein n=1 Tax=Prorocentrum cordatum TaxID=2364126 RepID=A0ABN9VL42_9DINO|nr:unnamed protein product [Polarella glacialis]